MSCHRPILSGMCTPVSTRPASVPSARMSSCGSGSWICRNNIPRPWHWPGYFYFQLLHARDGVRGHCLPEESGISSGIRIRYVRRKTGQRLVIRIEPCIAKLIGRYAGAGRISGYVFPLLSSDDPVRAFSQYRTALDYYNRRLKKLSGLLGLEVPALLYLAAYVGHRSPEP